VKGKGKRPTIQKVKKVLEAPKKSPIEEEEEEGQLLGPIGDNTTSLGKGTHTHTHIDMHFALCKAHL